MEERPILPVEKRIEIEKFELFKGLSDSNEQTSPDADKEVTETKRIVDRLKRASLGEAGVEEVVRAKPSGQGPVVNSAPNQAETAALDSQ